MNCIISPESIAALILVVCFPQYGHATIAWNWSFGAETGQFITDDGLGGGPGAYQLIDFSVTSSAVGATIGSWSGGQYTDGLFSTHSPYSFAYNGDVVTRWIHSGTNLYDWWTWDSPTSDIAYFFGWDSYNGVRVNDPTKAAWWTGNSPGEFGAYSVKVKSTLSPVPAPSSIWLFCTALLGLTRIGRSAVGRNNTRLP